MGPCSGGDEFLEAVEVGADPALASGLFQLSDEVAVPVPVPPRQLGPKFRIRV